MAFQADQRIKVQIITTLGSDQIFRLLSDQDIDVVMKTLGLLRNLLSNKSQIDHVMNLYGKQVNRLNLWISMKLFSRRR
jgi:armadillo repeat-containing protein 8